MSKLRSITQLVVLQPTSLCNLNCRYCYLAGRRAANYMGVDVLEAIGRNLCSSSMLHQDVEVSFHAGEPLLAGIEWFETAIEIMDRSWPPGARIVYSIQTNATLIDPRWTELFKRHNIRVSVSLDGPVHLNDVERSNWSGRGTCEKAVQGINYLRDGGVPFAVLCVLTETNVGHPEALFDLFEGLDPEIVAFNVEELEAANKRSSLSGSDGRAKVAKFFNVYFGLAASRGYPHTVRELDDMSKLMEASLFGTEVRNDVSTPLRILSVGWNGDVSTFSPELADVTSTRFNSFSLGNIKSGKPEHILDFEKMDSIHKEILAGIQLCRESCSFFPVCGGGAPANKLAEHGTFAGGETEFCRQTVQTVATITADILATRLQPAYRMRG